MNLAFPALILLIVFIPGAVFFYTYWGKLSKERELPVLSATLTGQAAKSFVVAAALQAVWLLLAHFLHYVGITNCVPNEQAFLTLIGGTDATIYQQKLNWASLNLWPIFVYFGSLYLASALLGIWLRNLVRRKKWDMKYEWLRFSNKWHYVLSGELIKAKTGKDVVPYLNAMVEIAGKPYVYGGVVAETWYEKEGDLEALSLAGVVRYTLNESLEPAGKPASVPGDLYLKCTEIKNLNIIYISS